MTAQEIRQKYLELMATNGHKIIPRANLVPQDDPTTLFTGSGMQPLVPYLLGQKHPDGTKLADSQTCFRAEDMDEVGDNRHTTFFEMLGNWSLGDYFKEQQLPMFWGFLTDQLGIDPQKLFVSCFIGDQATGVPKDTESGEIWQKLFADKNIDAKEVDLPVDDGYTKGMQGGRIFYYGAKHNWWSREGVPSNMREGEPGGPDSEVFYELSDVKHNTDFGQYCHPNCDCGRFLEIGNSVFMTYKKVGDKFEHLPSPNVDFGGGLERLAAAVIDSPDMFQISVIKPLIDKLEELSSKKYADHELSMQVIADHMRAAVWLAVDGVAPSNKQQGYLLRRLIRRAVRYALDLGLEQDLCQKIVPVVCDIFAKDYPEMAKKQSEISDTLSREEKLFRQTLRRGLQEFEKMIENNQLTAPDLFRLYDTYGFPVELSKEEAKKRSIRLDGHIDRRFNELMAEQRQRSQTASAGMFKGGLADHSEAVVKLHTTTHLMYQALKQVLGDHVVQRGSNITAERTRFDFSNPEKVSREQLDEVEKIVNQKIAEDLPVSWKEEDTKDAFAKGASGAFGDKYGDRVKVYTIGDPNSPFSREICGGPHVEHTGVIGEGGKKFKITKEEASSAGVRRIKAVLV